MTPQEINAYISQLFPGVRYESVGGSDGDPGNDQWIDHSGFGRDIKASQVLDLATQLNSMQQNAMTGSGNPGMSLTDDRLRQILSGAAQGGFSDFSQVGNYLSPQENQQFNAWKNWVDQENASMSFGDYLAMGTFALGAGALGGAALGGFGGAPVGEAAGWVSGEALPAGAMWGGAEAAPLFAGGASGGAIAGEGALGGLTGGASGAGVTGAVGGGLSGAAGAGLGAGALVAGETALSRILSGTATAADWAQIGGSVGAAGLGMLGSKAQGDAYSDVANKYLNLGAPYRDKLAASYAPGFSMADQPDFMNALDIGAQAAARATSAKYGSPVDNPGAYAEMQKYISGSLALPQLNTYRSQLGSFGQLGTNTAGTNDTQAAGQVGGMYNAAGYGLGQLTQPKNPYEDAMKGLLGGFKLNQGMSF